MTHEEFTEVYQHLRLSFANWVRAKPNVKKDIEKIQKECTEKFDCTIEELAENLETDEENLVNLLKTAIEKYNSFLELSKASNNS